MLQTKNRGEVKQCKFSCPKILQPHPHYLPFSSLPFLPADLKGHCPLVTVYRHACWTFHGRANITPMAWADDGMMTCCTACLVDMFLKFLLWREPRIKMLASWHAHIGWHFSPLEHIFGISNLFSLSDVNQFPTSHNTGSASRCLARRCLRRRWLDSGQTLLNNAVSASGPFRKLIF